MTLYPPVVERLNSAFAYHFEPFPITAIGWWEERHDAYMVMLTAEIQASLTFSTLTFPG